MNKSIASCSVFVLSIAFALPAKAAVLTVDSASDDPASPACTLRNAIRSANINFNLGGCVAAGAYGDDVITFDIGGATIALTSILPTIPAAAGGGSLRIIGGPGGQQAIDGGGAFGAFSGAVGSDLILESLHIHHTSSAADGAAITTLGSLRVRDGVFTKNTAAHLGGAIASIGGPLHVEGTVFVDNFAIAGGGAIYATGHVWVADSTFDSNQSGSDCNDYDCGGGSIYLVRTSRESGFVMRSTFTNSSPAAVRASGPQYLQVSGCYFAQNLGVAGSVLSGKALDVFTFEGGEDNRLELYGDTFIDNVGQPWSTRGALHASGFNVLMRDVQFENNEGIQGAGAHIELDPTDTLRVARCGFFHNGAAAAGGGLAVYGGAAQPDALVVNSTFAENGTNPSSNFALGGSIYAWAVHLRVLNTTLVSGDKNQHGVLSLDSTTAELVNSIISGPGGSDYSDCEAVAATVTGHHDIVTNAGAGGSDPCGLVNNKLPGVDAPSTTNAGTTILPLLPNSAAITGGDPATCYTPEVDGIDQRCAARWVRECDIGSYEDSPIP